jgi:hypothetical protein
MPVGTKCWRAALDAKLEPGDGGLKKAMTLREGIAQTVNDFAGIRKINIGNGPGARYVEILLFDGDRSKKFVITDEIPITVQIEEALRMMLPDTYDRLPIVGEGDSEDDAGWLLTRLCWPSGAERGVSQ